MYATVADIGAIYQRGCLGGKPIALSPIDGVRSGLCVRTLDDWMVYNGPVPTPRHPPSRLSFFPLSRL